MPMPSASETTVSCSFCLRWHCWAKRETIVSNNYGGQVAFVSQHDHMEKTNHIVCKKCFGTLPTKALEHQTGFVLQETL